MSESPEKNQMSVGNVCEFTANIIGGAKQANSARRASSARDSNQDVAKLEKEMSSREIRGTVQRRWTRADAKQRITWVRKLDPSVRKQLFDDFEQRHVNSNGAMWSIEGQPRDRYYEKRHDPLCLLCNGAGKSCRGKRARELLEEGNPMCGTLPKELCDPLTNAISFMMNPAPFRGCCKFTRDVWEHAVYLEGELHCAFGKRSVADCAPAVPLLLTVSDLNGLGPKGLRGVFRRCICPSLEIRVLVLRNIPKLISLDHEAIRSVHLHEAVFCNLPELRAVGDNWMDGCSYLRSITISNLPKLRYVGRGFLQGCISLKEVVFLNLPELTEVGYGWMRDCTDLRSINISKLPKLSKIGDHFLYQCLSLTVAVLQDLPELTEVGTFCLSRCRALEMFTLSKLPKLRKVGHSFLNHCTSLKGAVFQELPELSMVGGSRDDGREGSWMDSCTALETITISKLPKLSKIGDHFLHQSLSLKVAVFHDLPELTAVGRFCLIGCRALETITISKLPKLRKVEYSILRNCSLAEPSGTVAVLHDLHESVVQEK